jgi:hypothetical protein
MRQKPSPRQRVRRLACLVSTLALLVAPGCFVLDELDGKGTTAGGSAASKTAKTQAAVEPMDTSSGRAKLQAYYNRKSRRQVDEDPNDPIVRCLSGGSVQFMRKYQCELRGGQIRD